MKTLLVLLVLLAGATYLWKHGGKEKLEHKVDRMAKGDVSKDAKLRVETILSGIEKGGGGVSIDLQTSVCQWDRGAILIKDSFELDKVLDRFNRWCGEKGFYNRRIRDWQVLDSTCDESGDNCVVTVRIEGQTSRMKVPRGKRISWAE
jgi:hypothetical protein